MSLELEEVSRQLEWLQALAVSMVADRQAAEDLVQRALQEATSKKDWQPGRLKPWLVGTVLNMSRQYFRTESRRRKRELRVVEAAERRARNIRGASATTPPEELAEQVESQKLLSSAVMDLQEPYRETLLLFYYGGRSQQQVADELGVSVRTVETRLRRAREQLRKRLEGQYGKESWALGVLPLIKRFPPPTMPPPLPVAGLGSLGGGWWATASLILVAVGWNWSGGHETEAVVALPEVGAPAVAQIEPVASTEPFLRSQVDGRHSLESESVATTAATVQDFVLEERGTGVGLPDLQLQVLFLRPANAEQRLHREAPEFFQPQDRIWWKLGEDVATSDAQGVVRFDIPLETTHIMVRLGTHSATHSLTGYSIRFKTFMREEIAGKRIPLEMVRRTGTASGYVVDDENNPLADVLVDVFFDAPRSMSKQPVMTIPTEANGSFSIPNIACDQGGFRLRPRGEGYASSRSMRMQRYAGFGVDYPGISLVLTPAGKQTMVLVQENSGHPISGASVMARQALNTDFDSSYSFGTYLADWSATAETDENGAAFLHDLPAGDLEWSAIHQDFQSPPPDIQQATSNRTFTLSSGNAIRCEIQVEGKPVAGASVGLFSKTQRRYLLSDAEGVVEFSGLLAEEDFYLTVTHADYAFWQKGHIQAIGRLQTETVELQSGHSISGRVEWNTHADGLLGERPRVFVRPIQEDPLTSFPMRENQRADTGWWQVAGMDEALVADDGSFSFHGLPDTEVEIWFGLRRRPLGFAQAHSGDTDVLLYLDSGMSDKTTFDVHVFDELSGRPVTIYYLFLTNHNGAQPVRLPAAIVRDGSGRFRHRGLASGTWSALAWAPQGFTTKRLTPRFFSPGQHALEIPLAAARSLRLRFLDEAGETLEGVVVSARAEDGSMLLQGGLLGGGFREWSTTDARGQVAMSHVPETQPYRLVCKYQGQEHTFELPGARVEGELREMVFPGLKRD